MSTYEQATDLHQQDITAAKKRVSFPRSASSRLWRPDWWFYSEGVQEYKHRVKMHRKLYKMRPNDINVPP